MHLPDTPPYVVRLAAPTLGQGEPSAFSPIKPETVLVAVTPSAPPVTQNNVYKHKELTDVLYFQFCAECTMQ